MKLSEEKHYCAQDPHERPTGSSKPEDMTDFQKGARAMFDNLMFRAANHWHGNPKVNAICIKENKLIEEWAADALEEVSPQDSTTWRSINEAYEEGKTSGYAKAVQEMHDEAEDELDAEAIKDSAARRFKSCAVLFWLLANFALALLIHNASTEGSLSYAWKTAVITCSLASVAFFFTMKHLNIVRPQHRDNSVPPRPLPPSTPPSCAYPFCEPPECCGNPPVKRSNEIDPA